MDLVLLHDVPLGRLVVVAGQLASQRWNRLLASKFRLTNAGMVVLLTLHRHGELSHGDLAGLCFVRPATLTGVLDTLEKADLVERRRDGADRRAVRIGLTVDGGAQAVSLAGLIRNPRPLTSVDADPEKAAVIREFLLELIGKLADDNVSNGEDSTWHPR